MHILLPLPDRDFDVTEVAVPWKLLTDLGHEVVIATEHGDGPPAADPLLITGVLFGQLGAEPEPKEFYQQLTEATAFRRPLAWADLKPEVYDGLILPGGHAPGMRQYLGSDVLREKIATTPPPSSSRTADTFPPAGPATPTSSRGASPRCSPERPESGELVRPRVPLHTSAGVATPAVHPGSDSTALSHQHTWGTSSPGCSRGSRTC
ncbi:type 1 glutamine amidotransferase domain-containing protein [Streptomyces violaceusniger]